MAKLAAVLLGGVFLLIGWGVYLEGLVRYWDKKIAALCAADGGRNVGLRVYEKVMAPEHYIRPASGAMPASVFIPWRLKYTPPKSSEPIVMVLMELEVLRDSSPRVVKYSTQIIRESDSKVLAEEIQYMRSGGGIPMPDPSGYISCPANKLTGTGTLGIYSAPFTNDPSSKISEKTQ